MYELKALQEEEKVVLKEYDSQEGNRVRLELEEERYWKEYSKHRNEFILVEDEHRRFNII